MTRKRKSSAKTARPTKKKAASRQAKSRAKKPAKTSARAERAAPPKARAIKAALSSNESSSGRAVRPRINGQSVAEGLRAVVETAEEERRCEVSAEQLPQLEIADPPDIEGSPIPLTADPVELPDDDEEAISEEVPELGIGSRVVAPNTRFEEDAVESYRPVAASDGDVADQIRALEARLDGLIQSAARSEPKEPASDVSRVVRSSEARSAPEPSEGEEHHLARDIAVENAAELAESDYYVKKWGRQGLRNLAEEIDEFGLDRNFEAKLRPAIDFLYRRYFRVQTEGMNNVPSTGRAVIIGNHSGAIPLDGVMLRAALRLDHPSARELRWLAEDFLFYLPFAGVFMNRAGAVRACQENAERLLLRDNLVGVFPEGVQGIRKLFRDRYRLQRFGRGGYIRLCLRTRTPLVPCAIIGGEESNPLLYRFDAVADLLRIPYLPVTPTFPALGVLGLLPAPTKWRIRFGEPIPFDHYGPEAADDHVLVGRLSDRVRSTIQSMLDSGLQRRKSVWF